MEKRHKVLAGDHPAAYFNLPLEDLECGNFPVFPMPSATFEESPRLAQRDI